MKIKFVTCIYSNLYNTELGGRQSREIHYKFSLLSILKITNATYILYTSPEEFNELSTFFYDNNNISREILEIREFDLKTYSLHPTLSKKRLEAEHKHEDRCFEIQYLKFEWLGQEVDKGDDFIFWIDAGLSHSGLFPKKYQTIKKQEIYRHYFEFSIFTNKLIENLVSYLGDKLFLIGKENRGIHYWSRTVPHRYYTNFNSDIHIIGGMFGGKPEKVKVLVDLFNSYLADLLNEPELFFEEMILSLIYQNHKDYFQPEFFTIWYSEDEVGPYPLGHEIYKGNKRFYEIFEKFI